MVPSSEIWGTYLPKLDKKLGTVKGVNLEYFDAEYIEKVALRFHKLILGVNKKATNVAVRGELGRYPNEIDMWHRSIRIFLNL